MDRPALRRLLADVEAARIDCVPIVFGTGFAPRENICSVLQRVQAILQRNGRTGGALVRNKFGALLKGILRCAPCGCTMAPSHSTKGGNKRYRYYVCCGAQKHGWHTCPSKSVPATEIERVVVE
jgi:Recombinase zinc beta ribbon domain